ncbi:MAG: 3-oxoacyl-[acyl-carrier-protein] synthase III C-terminal domain-containing protein [Porticoccaceae bacterium]|nr:3-oxoacyl-[acyl-carrier-protein] synthase III C-terminal domain-containing protein [Porticoccaceae bacterium]
MVGITAYGAYLPRMRLQKQVIADANAWFDPGLKGLAKGEKAICNWDEDTITMAVEAFQDCLGNKPGQAPAALLLASTTLPFSDRQNSVVVAEALNLETSNLRTMDITCSQRAATSGLLSALDIAAAGKEAVLVASEHRRAKCASREEMLYGDGAAAVAVGGDNVLAELVASHSQAVDFVDHYRGEGEDFDYGWEERWVRDEGYMKIVPNAVSALLSKAGVSGGDIAHFVLPTDQGRVPAMVAKKLGIKGEAVADNLLQSVGITGAAHVMLLLAHRLEQAAPGDLVLVAGFGQGCDVLLFKVTDAISQQALGKGVSGHLSNGRPETNYNKYQSFNNLLEKELGKRSEVNKQGYLSAMYRARGLTNSFLGGKCSACGTVQIPKHKYCVNPECGAYDTQVDHPMAGAQGTVATWTADTLTFDYNPPAYFGMVTFEGGGRIMMDMSEVDAETFDTGSKVSMHFRLKQIDDQAGFRKYFWKAIQV